MKKTTVFIIVDAGRRDYVDPDSMPFVHGLAGGSVTGSFESPPGFAQRTVLFSGRYPDTSGNFSAFVYDPENSPFKWVSRLGPLQAAIRPRKLLFPARVGINKVTKMVTGAYHTDPAWIPPKYLPFFRPCEDMQPLYEPGALGATSIFDLCRAHGKTYKYLAHPVSGDDDEIHQMLVRSLRKGEDVDLFVAQFSVTDEMGHHHGPFSEAMREGFLRELDQKIASVHAALSANYDEWELFLCGDHGMAPVREEVNILEMLKQADAEPAKDYVVFVNSTLAVFWYLTEKGRTEVERILPQVPGSHVVTDKERARRRIPMDRRWGDRMLAADPGTMYWPDYFHVTDHNIVGMHGYLDKSEEAMGMAVLASSAARPTRELGTRPLVDVFPTLCDMIGVPVPKTSEGRSMLRRSGPRASRGPAKGAGRSGKTSASASAHGDTASAADKKLPASSVVSTTRSIDAARAAPPAARLAVAPGKQGSAKAKRAQAIRVGTPAKEAHGSKARAAPWAKAKGSAAQAAGAGRTSRAGQTRAAMPAKQAQAKQAEAKQAEAKQAQAKQAQAKQARTTTRAKVSRNKATAGSKTHVGR